MMVVNTRCDIVTAFGFSNAPSLLALAIHCASPEIPIYLVLRKRMSSLWTMDYHSSITPSQSGAPMLHHSLGAIGRLSHIYRWNYIVRDTAGSIYPLPPICPQFVPPYGVADDMDVTALLAACISVENLWIAEIDDEMLSFASLSPKQLYTNGLPALAPANPFFSQITHLELFAIQEEDTNKFSRLSLIPQLTHLSFNGGIRIPGDWARHSEDIQTQNLLKDIRWASMRGGLLEPRRNFNRKTSLWGVPVLQFEILEDESQPGPRQYTSPKISLRVPETQILGVPDPDRQQTRRSSQPYAITTKV
ncbi:hypothetical protein B0H17DRAFT_1185678 [Mycena rosella]|uniref:Uncharacterized protein n=1 Tax=Mycena rosella TaxID=1033263 RepID=A0AAD7CT26_MYCRO|nr:hypothetical protein B0H17DRAFT_1185678 [Mycena rosella]